MSVVSSKPARHEDTAGCVELLKCTSVSWPVFIFKLAFGLISPLFIFFSFAIRPARDPSQPTNLSQLIVIWTEFLIILFALIAGFVLCMMLIFRQNISFEHTVQATAWLNLMWRATSTFSELSAVPSSHSLMMYLQTASTLIQPNQLIGERAGLAWRLLFALGFFLAAVGNSLLGILAIWLKLAQLASFVALDVTAWTGVDIISFIGFVNQFGNRLALGDELLGPFSEIGALVGATVKAVQSLAGGLPADGIATQNGDDVVISSASSGVASPTPTPSSSPSPSPSPAIASVHSLQGPYAHAHAHHHVKLRLAHMDETVTRLLVKLYGPWGTLGRMLTLSKSEVHIIFMALARDAMNEYTVERVPPELQGLGPDAPDRLSWLSQAQAHGRPPVQAVTSVVTINPLTVWSLTRPLIGLEPQHVN